MGVPCYSAAYLLIHLEEHGCVVVLLRAVLEPDHPIFLVDGCIDLTILYLRTTRMWFDNMPRIDRQ